MTLILGFAPPHGMDFFWLFIIFVLLFGAQKLPELARGLGKSLKEFKKAQHEFEQELNAPPKEEAKTPAQAPIPGTLAKSNATNPEVTKNN